MKKVLMTIGSYLLDPIRKVGLSRISDTIVSYSNKNPWFKVFVSFVIVGLVVVLYYVYKFNIFE